MENLHEETTSLNQPLNPPSLRISPDPHDVSEENQASQPHSPIDEYEEDNYIASGAQSPLTILEEEEREIGGGNTGTSVSLPYRPRRASPSRVHFRPHPVSAPPMQRAYSSPGLDSSGRYIAPTIHTPRRPSSPLFSGRRRSPLRSSMDDIYTSSSFSGLNIEPNIPENEELDLSHDNELSHASSLPLYSNTFPRARRRPASPLHQSASAPSLHARAASPNLSHSPTLPVAAQKYANESYPVYSFSSTSSMPSTPTSLRSRSPSISSLDTIEDTPDAEEAARLEEEEDLRQRGDDSDGGSGNEGRRRNSTESRGTHLKSNKERKRWSVCGAERRADFSLEPIEE